jgi:ribosomal-protein-alanine N-acetyltransferase
VTLPDVVAPRRVRRATPDDLAEILRIERMSFSDPWSAGNFASSIADPAVYLCVAESPVAEIVGYAVLRAVSDEGEILNLAVAPSARGQGFARALMADAMAAAVARRVSTVYLEVRESNRVAIALYETFGFAPAGRRRRYYRLPDEDALVFRAELDGLSASD